jgi:hypothetical protein
MLRILVLISCDRTVWLHTNTLSREVSIQEVCVECTLPGIDIYQEGELTTSLTATHLTHIMEK